MQPSLDERARVHAALGDPRRLAIVDQLAISDCSPKELGTALDLPTNLMAHHLDALEQVGLIERTVSGGDRRRRYVRLRRGRLTDLGLDASRPLAPVVFVCSKNSARSQLAAALWQASTGQEAASAGTTPADSVHPKAIAAAARAGLDLRSATPRALDDALLECSVVTVCDQAHEELGTRDGWRHWSIPDPVALGTDAAFDAARDEIEDRIRTLR